jgi:DUF4097 and DUF4098 domain-containing protein YvlB
MASPVQTPPPGVRPPRSLAGPIVLIVLGVVFLMGTMGILHWNNLGIWFARYWPVLIILWGVIKLLEYQQSQRAGVRPRGIGAGGILMLVILVVAGLAATQAARFNWSTIRDQINIDESDFPLFGHSYNYEDQLQQDYPAGATLHVVDDRGAVNVNDSTDNQIHISVRKRINADNQQEADKWNASTKPQITVSGGTVNVNANTQGAGDHWVATDMDISIPRRAPAIVSTRRGDVNVMGRDGDVEISNQHGDVAVSDINGKVTLDLEHSSARISQIASDVSIDGRANDVSIEDVKGAVRLNGEFLESIKLARIAKSVMFKSSRTDLEFASLAGDLDLDSGDLRASDVTGPLRLSTRSKDIRLEGVSGDVRLSDQNGGVELHMVKMGSVQVDNRSGDVELYFPDKASFQVDARARGGEVQTDFSQITVQNENNLATGKGTVGSGGPRVVVNNEHGTVEIRKGSSAAAEAPEPPPAPKAPRVKIAKPVEPTEQ